MMRWTFSRKSLLGFAVAAVTSLSLSAIMLYSIDAMQVRQDRGTAAARKTLTIVDAAALSAKAYQVIATVLVDPSFVQAENVWSAQKAAADELFGEVRGVLDEAQDKRLLALAMLSYGEIAEAEGFIARVASIQAHARGLNSRRSIETGGEIAFAACSVLFEAYV